MEETLNSEQIQNWRKIIFIQLEEIFSGAGAYALIMPESEVIDYWRKTKSLLEKPHQTDQPDQQKIVRKSILKKQCDHTNSIIGGKGKYCIDCERYV